MGLNLKLLIETQPGSKWTSGHLDVGQDYPLFDAIKEVVATSGRIKAPDVRHCNTEGKYIDNMFNDALGDPIMGVTAFYLKKKLKEHPIDYNDWKSQAMRAYIIRIPDQTEIWIYWN